MELMSLEQPLMQELMVTIPGTYHHPWWWPIWWRPGPSISAPTACSARWRPHHDVGKLSYPEYFIENQFGGPNKHDKLAPSMSALILLARQKGTELG